MTKDAPTLGRHKRSGHRYARIDGRQIWFGPYEDPKTHEQVARTLAEWRANGRRLPPGSDRINRVVRLFGWAAEEELCKPEVYGALRALRPLKRCRSAAREGKRVISVEWKHVEGILPHVSRQLPGVIASKVSLARS